MKILHFIGTVKPWLQNFDPQTKNVGVPQGYAHLKEFLQLWWNIFCSDVHPRLSAAMVRETSFFFVDLSLNKFTLSILIKLRLVISNKTIKISSLNRL